MKKIVYIAVIVVEIFLGRRLDASRIACFSPGSVSICTEPALQHVKFKSVVMEFLDPQQTETELGHSVSRLMWREIYQSILNLRNAGVLLADDAEGFMNQYVSRQNYLEILEKDYHTAVIEMAKYHDAQMSAWGVVFEYKETIYIDGFLTIHPSTRPWNLLRLRNPVDQKLALEAKIPHTRINFPQIKTTRKALFDRPLFTRCGRSTQCPRGIEFRSAPRDDATFAYYPVGVEVRGINMTEQWVHVRDKDGKQGYINVYHVEKTPPAIRANAPQDFSVYGQPGNAQSALGTESFESSYPVLGVRKLRNGELWYRIVGNKLEGWVNSRHFQPQWSLPMVHFIAGLYRYARADYSGAAREFKMFIARSAATEDNVTLAAAFQFLAASQVAGEQINKLNSREVMDNLTKAIDLTPYDPAAYTLRALVKLGIDPALASVLEDLRAALELDRRDSGAQSLLSALKMASERSMLQLLMPRAIDIQEALPFLQGVASRFPQ